MPPHTTSPHPQLDQLMNPHSKSHAACIYRASVWQLARLQSAQCQPPGGPSHDPAWPSDGQSARPCLACGCMCHMHGSRVVKGHDLGGACGEWHPPDEEIALHHILYLHTRTRHVPQVAGKWAMAGAQSKSTLHAMYNTDPNSRAAESHGARQAGMSWHPACWAGLAAAAERQRWHRSEGWCVQGASCCRGWGLAATQGSPVCRGKAGRRVHGMPALYPSPLLIHRCRPCHGLHSPS